MSHTNYEGMKTGNLELEKQRTEEVFILSRKHMKTHSLRIKEQDSDAHSHRYICFVLLTHVWWSQNNRGGVNYYVTQILSTTWLLSRISSFIETWRFSFVIILRWSQWRRGARIWKQFSDKNIQTVLIASNAYIDASLESDKLVRDEGSPFAWYIPKSKLQMEILERRKITHTTWRKLYLLWVKKGLTAVTCGKRKPEKNKWKHTNRKRS